MSRARRLAPQLLIYTVLPLTLLLMAVALVGLRLHQGAMRQMVGERDERAVRAAAAALEEQLRQRAAAVESLALHAAAVPPAMALADVAAFRGKFAALALYDAAGGLLAADDPAWWQQLAPVPETAAAHFLPPAADPATGQPIVVFFAPLARGGWAAGAFDPAAAAREIAGRVVLPGDHAAVYLAAADGALLFQAGDLGEHAGPDAVHPGVAEALRGESGTTYLPIAGGEHVVSYTPVAPVGWALVMEEDWRAMSGPLLRGTEFVPFVLLPALAATLAAAIAGSGPVSEILINEDVSAWPASGIVSIGGERFLYNGRDFYRRAFTGVSRAAYNSGASAHAVGDTVDWLQHEVWVVYTPGLNVAKATDDGRKPLLKLPESSNATWVWEEFGSAAAPERTAQWTPVVNGTATIFTGDQNGAATDPYAVMGIAKPAAGANLVENLGRWQTYLPCGLSGYTVDGADYENSLTVIEVSSDGTAWQEADLSPTGTGWEDWTETATGLSAALRYLAVRMRQVGAASDVLSQVEKVTATLQTGLRPTGNIGVSEQSNYQLEMTITNETTDEAFSLSPLPGLVVVSTESVEVDTEAKTATLMPLGANVYSALRRDALRLSMLRLQPGNNTIRVEETGIAGVTVTVSFRPRWYA